MKFIIYTDGGSRGNPGPAALGVFITDDHGNLVYKKGLYLGIQTNNFAEYSALVHALEVASGLGGQHLDVRMDSELIVRQMNGQYKIKEPTLVKLARQVKILAQEFREVSYTHVRREYNKEADKMVNIALDEENRN